MSGREKTEFTRLQLVARDRATLVLRLMLLMWRVRLMIYTMKKWCLIEALRWVNLRFF